MNRHWVGIDWGTANLRAWIFDEADVPCSSFTSEQGAASLSGAQFETVLLSLIGGQLSAQRQIEVFCCGMVGSRQGWVEAAYQMTPAELLPEPDEMKISLLPYREASHPMNPCLQARS